MRFSFRWKRKKIETLQDGNLLCKILLLDGNTLEYKISKNSRGEEVFEAASRDLDLEEKEYFGLSFTDAAQVTHWIDPTKKVRKQIPIGPPYSTRFLVKYCIANPDELQEEVTRYLFYQHIRNEILYGRLECPDDILIKLAGYILQSEIGDFDEEQHTEGYVSEFRFIPEMIQTEELEKKIVEYHKACEGQTPAEAEKNFLTVAKTIDMYGVDLHYVLGDLEVGLAPNGIIIFRRSIRIDFFYWPNIVNLEFKGKKFIVVTKGEGEETDKVRYEFKLGSSKNCKHLWKSAIEQHSFYRLTIPDGPVKRRFSLFRTRSSFRFSGRTLYQAQSMRKKAPRQSMSVKRTPSQRQSRRSQRPIHLSQKQSPPSNITTKASSANDDILNPPKSKSDHEIDGLANKADNVSNASTDDHQYTEVTVEKCIPDDSESKSKPSHEQLKKYITDSETTELQRTQSHFMILMPSIDRLLLRQTLRRSRSLSDVVNQEIAEESITELIRTWKMEKKLHDNIDDDEDAMKDYEEIKDQLNKLMNKFNHLMNNGKHTYRNCKKEQELIEKFEKFKDQHTVKHDSDKGETGGDKVNLDSHIHKLVTATTSDSGSSYAATTEQLRQVADIDQSDDEDLMTTDL